LKNIFVIVCITSLLLAGKVSAQKTDSSLINQLLCDVAAAQYKTEGKYGFRPGMFYSYKKWAGYPHRYSPDNNIFYTAIIAFALQNMLPDLSAANQVIAKDIIKKAIAAYPLYQNKNGLPSYFFWQGGVPIMPHTLFAYKLSGLLATSEDVDDSIMLLMTSNASDSIVKKLKLVMDSVANGQLRTITNTSARYKKLPAHTTYLGHKMRVDFDLAVHCNVLYFLYQNKLPFNRFDTATLQLVVDMVKKRAYKKQPAYVAPYYVSTTVQLYHIARLMGKFKVAELEPYRQQLANDLQTQQASGVNIMEDIIIQTSLKWLGIKTEKLPITGLQQFNKSNQLQFVFYQARAASQLPNPFKKLLLHFSMLNYHFFCPAYNKVLLLEYLINP